MPSVIVSVILFSLSTVETNLWTFINGPIFWCEPKRVACVLFAMIFLAVSAVVIVLFGTGLSLAAIIVGSIFPIVSCRNSQGYLSVNTWLIVDGALVIVFLAFKIMQLSTKFAPLLSGKGEGPQVLREAFIYEDEDEEEESKQGPEGDLRSRAIIIAGSSGSRDCDNDFEEVSISDEDEVVITPPSAAAVAAVASTDDVWSLRRKLAIVECAETISLFLLVLRMPWTIVGYLLLTKGSCFFHPTVGTVFVQSLVSATVVDVCTILRLALEGYSSSSSSSSGGGGGGSSRSYVN